VTVPRTRDIYIRRRRVPLAEVHFSIPENFPMVWTNETGESGVEVTSVCGGVEVGGFAILPAPRNLESWLGFERNGRGAEFQMRGLETIFTTVGVLKRLWIFV